MHTRSAIPTLLSERYVHAVTRRLPPDQRDDVADELRAGIDDRVESLLGPTSALSRVEAERAAIEELGDPALLSDGYTGTRRQLIGPELYPGYVCVLKGVLVTVVPVVTVLIAVIQALTGSSFGAVVGETVWMALNLSVHIAFWVTVTFVLIERGSAPDDVRDALGTEWDPDQLPELPRASGGSVSDLAASVVFLSLIGAAIVWQQLRPSITADGERVPALDPDLWSFWLPLVLVLLVVEIGFEVVKYRLGWSVRLATANTVLAAVFAAPLVYLAATERLLNPAAVAGVQEEWAAFDPAVAHTVVLVSAVVIAVWDTVDGWVKTRAVS